MQSYATSIYSETLDVYNKQEKNVIKCQKFSKTINNKKCTFRYQIKNFLTQELKHQLIWNHQDTSKTPLPNKCI